MDLRKELSDLERYRFDFSEEIPDRILGPEDPGYHRFKCRTNFFHAVNLRIFWLLRCGGLGPETAASCREYLKFTEELRGKKEKNGPGEISKANAVLDLLIADIKPRVGGGTPTRAE